MQVKKRGITLKRLTESCPGMDQLNDAQAGYVASSEPEEVADEDQLTVLTLDDILVEVLEDLEDTLELLSNEAVKSGAERGT